VKIKKPAPIKVLVGGTEQPLPIERFIRFSLIDRDPRFNNSGKAIRTSARIDARLAACAELDHIDGIEAEDYAVLRDVAETPADGYGLSPARIVLPFVDAIVCATEEEKP
jgi:hypothetical protein